MCEFADKSRMGLLSKATKYRKKMNIVSFIGNKPILRIILIVSMACYLPWASLLPITVKWKTLQSIPAEAENGIGGISPERILAESGQELTGIPEPEEFSKPHMVTFSFYVMEKGDIIGNIAVRAGLNEDTLISVNGIKNARLMQIGQVIKIPNQDGIYYTVKTGDTLHSIAEKYQTTVSHINTANERFLESVAPNENLFIPGAKMDWMSRQEVNGDLFIWPCSGYISSNYGYRMAPFAGSRQFHTGVDMAAPLGSPLRAAMAGRVVQVGYDSSFGNFVWISHHSGYRTFYGHMDVVTVKAGAYVGTGERIGDVGSSGLSTGPHVHFSVYQNGVTVNPRSVVR
jgi:murein DD-endopeptidase MepM/ murein hydrolase activator NlpD